MRTCRRAEVGVAIVRRAIRALGLALAPHKTEAMWFFEPRRGVPPSAQLWLEVDGCRIVIGRGLRYLGLYLDSHGRFDVHFDCLAHRLEQVATNLGRLLPNLGGPGVRVRRLYVGIVRSIALNGAPIWAGDLAVSRRSCTLLRRVESRLAIRIVR